VFPATAAVSCAAFIAILWAANQPPRPLSAALVRHIARTAAAMDVGPLTRVRLLDALQVQDDGYVMTHAG
jgi:hypothetical protein